MRGLAIVTALLVLLVPAAAAQPGEGGSSSSTSSSTDSPASSSSSSSTGPAPDGNATGEDPGPAEDACSEDDERTPEERRACYCREHPDDLPCQRGQGDREDDRRRSRQELESFGSDRDARHVTFVLDAANLTLRDYAVDGRVVLEAIHLDTGSGNLSAERKGPSLRLGDEDTELVLHDNPTGLVRFKGDDGSVTLVLPDGAGAATASDGSASRIAYPDGRVGHVRAANATWLAPDTVLGAGFLAFLLPPAREDRPAADPSDAGEAAEAAELGAKVEQAIERRRVGAEVSIAAPQADARAAVAGDEPVQILAYDDVEVEVSLPRAAATPESPIRVEVSAELEEGRTIVLNLDREVLGSDDPRALVLQYYDIHVQAGAEVLTEVRFDRAPGGLQDILDPTDDGGQPEYWVVEDANGLQVLVSVPHWSAHAITVASLAEALSEPNVLYGVVVGVAGSALAAVAMLWPRRPEDE